MPGETPKRLSFGECPKCPYRAAGPAELCFACANDVVQQIPAARCILCDGALRDDQTCGNPLCRWTEEKRGWSYGYALAERSGVLENRINRYKYDGKHGWATIFARLLLGYLDENFTPGEDHGVIVSSPTFVGAGGRPYDHTGLVLEQAAKTDPKWPMAPGAIVKTTATSKMVGKNWQQRMNAATDELMPALSVPDRSVVAGRDVLLFDDVFTSGITSRATALKLQEAGAGKVDVVVLARQPFRG